MDRVLQPASGRTRGRRGVALRSFTPRPTATGRCCANTGGWCFSTTARAGLAFGAWKTASQQVVFVSKGKIMVSGKINISEAAVYSEEMNQFLTTQREMMQDETVRQRAEERVRTQSPETAISPVTLSVAPIPQTTIFVLTAIGSEPAYPQKFVDAVMDEYIATRQEMRTAKSESTESKLGVEIKQQEVDSQKRE